jgi:hypothetical protein
VFRNTTRCIKRTFFDEKIKEIATLNCQPWDLMSWVKARKLPAIDAIHYNDSFTLRDTCPTLERSPEHL